MDITLKKVTPAGLVTTLAGNGGVPTLDGTLLSAKMGDPAGICIDPTGNIIYVAEWEGVIRKIDIAGNSVVTVAGLVGSRGCVDGQGSNARFDHPNGICIDATGNFLYVTDTYCNTIRKIDIANGYNVTTIAGTGAPATSNVTGPGISTPIFTPWAICIDPSNNLYFTEKNGHKIKKLTPTGTLSTLAGTASLGYADGASTVAQFLGPTGICYTSTGELLVAEDGNRNIRLVSPITGSTSTIAGDVSHPIGYVDGPAMNAQFTAPNFIWDDAMGNIYIGDAVNFDAGGPYISQRLRKLTCQSLACPTLTLSVTSKSNVTCFGTNTGTATVNTTGGAGSYTYTWMPGNLTGASNNSLSAGIYTVSVKDLNNCTGSFTFAITQPTNSIAFTSVVSLPDKCNLSNGSATVNVTGGTPAYSYSWIPNGATSSTSNGLSAGSYTIIATDNNGCFTNTTVVISSIAPPTLSVTSQLNVTCFGANTGSASIIAIGGTSPYTYFWMPNSLFGTTQQSLTAGDYQVFINDANNCTGSGTVTITQPTVALALTVTSNPSACGTSNGTATVTATGGTPSYTYSWMPLGTVGSSILGLASGIYTVSVIDNFNCTANNTVQINSASGPSLAIVSQQSVNCLGANTGSATIGITGGSSPYTYTWLPNNFTGSSQSALSAGQYTVIANDLYNCQTTLTLVISQPTSAINITSINSTDDGCAMGNGSATVIATGGIPVYSYSWFPTGGNNAIANGLTAGNYSVEVMDNNGCKTNTVVTVINIPAPTISITSVNHVNCFGANTGSATVTSAGGNGTYTWSPNNLVGASQNALSAGIYTVSTLASSGSCIGTQTLAITQPTSALLATITASNTHCGNSIGSATVTITGGTPTYQYEWSQNAGNSSIATNLSSGYYVVVITDAKSCTVSAITNIINASQSPTLTVLSNTTLISPSSQVTLTAISNATLFSWNPSVSLNCSSCTTVIASPNENTTYCVIGSLETCTVEACIEILIDKACKSNFDKTVPTAFSPNGDGVNDAYCVQGWEQCASSFYMSIFDRWGEKIYETTDPNFCWDGTYKGKVLDPAVFIYYLKAEGLNIGKVAKKGNITLIK